MVAGIRAVERALGQPEKGPTPSERKNLTVARKSLVAARAIRRGETFTPENLTTKRPGNGISAMQYDAWLGRVADRDYEADELIRV
jgi:sialic acid synthase SpsE